MDEALQAQIGTYLSHLDKLIRRGRELHDALVADPADTSVTLATRMWQQDCGVAIHQLSGGSKAHWLARSFSQAFLLRTADGHAVEGAAPDKIVARLLEVLYQAVTSLSSMGGPGSSASSPMPAPRRFEFVHNPEIRPVVEQAYAESRRALEQRHYDLALRTACGVLEAIVTDALERKGLSALATSGAPEGRIADWSFETRLTVAERAGLIRRGCARLPEIARTYRDHQENEPGTTVSERDARQVGQVLRVVMRDLDPGR